MKHCRKYADYAHCFADDRMVAECLERIADRSTAQPDGCVVLPAYADGYSRARFGGVVWLTHRLLWMIEHGDIGELVIDHKCRNRACVNIAHIEPVTNAENVKRGKIVAHGGKCAKGHTLTQKGPQLHCATCKNERHRARYRDDPEYRRHMQDKCRRNRARAKAA